MSERKLLEYISDHSLNKDDPLGIVYRFCNEETQRVTAEQCYCGASFEECKSFSDENYAEIDKDEHQYNRYKVPLFDQDIPSPSAEDWLIEKENQQEQEEKLTLKRAVARIAVQHLTSTQQRRYYMYYGEKMSFRKIGRAEHVSHTAVRLSVEQARTIIKKIICKLFVKTPFQNTVFMDLSEEGDNPLFWSLKTEQTVLRAQNLRGREASDIRNDARMVLEIPERSTEP